MRAELFDYTLPPERIARHPPEARDGAKMLTLREGGVEHGFVADWVELVPPRAVVVLNDTRVRWGRVRLRRRQSGAKVELLLLRPLSPLGRGRPSEPAQPELWECLARANRPIAPGWELEGDGLSCRVLRRLGGGILEVELEAEGGVETYLEASGSVPLPPYLGREDEAADRERYQTVFAKELGSAAAPTAGLHITEAGLGRLRARGVKVATVTLHVGLGTFRPVSAEKFSDHEMHEEWVEVSEESATAIRDARGAGGKVIAVGTTVVRALETAARSGAPGGIDRYRGPTQLMILPGHRFRVVDGLLTNFHQPRSTLLGLVAAFVGRERLLGAYGSALDAGYPFLSYGDAMWIPQRLP